MGHTIAKKVFHKTVSIGKKLGAVALGAGALLSAVSYGVGAKEMAKSREQTASIRDRALEEEAKRSSVPTAPPPPQTSQSKGYDKRVVTRSPESGNLVLKKDDVAAGRAEGPTQDPMDAAVEAAKEGASAAGQFKAGQKKGGLIRKMKPSNPFGKKKP